MTTPPLTQGQCQAAVSALEQAIAEGFQTDGLPSAWAEAGRRMGLAPASVRNRVDKGREKFGLVVRRAAPPRSVGAIR